MAIGTLTRHSRNVVGNQKHYTFDVQLTSGANYTTGGETITAGQVGLKYVTGVEVIALPQLSDGSASRQVVARTQTPASSVKIAVHSGAAEVASNTDLSTYTARLVFRGR